MYGPQVEEGAAYPNTVIDGVEVELVVWCEGDPKSFFHCYIENLKFVNETDENSSNSEKIFERAVALYPEDSEQLVSLVRGADE